MMLHVEIGILNDKHHAMVVREAEEGAVVLAGQAFSCLGNRLADLRLIAGRDERRTNLAAERHRNGRNPVHGEAGVRGVENLKLLGDKSPTWLESIHRFDLIVRELIAVDDFTGRCLSNLWPGVFAAERRTVERKGPCITRKANRCTRLDVFDGGQTVLVEGRCGGGVLQGVVRCTRERG